MRLPAYKCPHCQSGQVFYSNAEISCLQCGWYKQPDDPFDDDPKTRRLTPSRGYRDKDGKQRFKVIL